MTKLYTRISLFIILLISTQLSAQTVVGDWYGALNIQGNNLKLVFHITETDNGYSATFDSPAQGASGIPFTSAF